MESSVSSSSETSSGTRYLIPSEADSHQFHADSLDEMVRGLMKFPANQMCLNCNSQGPQYVCTSLCAFVCKTCSDIHQEFGHVVKSVSEKFTFEEVDALVHQRGNEDMVKFRPETSLPDSSDVVGLRKFIRRCYVDGRDTSDTDEEAQMEEAQEKRRKAKGKAREEGSGRKRKIEEVVGLQPENAALIIRDLPSLSLPPSEFLMKLRDLIRLTVAVSQASQPLIPVIACTGSGHLSAYPWKDLTIDQMAKKGFTTVEGEVRCLDCGTISTASFDWREAWVKSASYMFANFIIFGGEIYSNWTPPSDIHIECEACLEKKAVPSITSTMETNWLFVFFTNMSSYVPAPILEEYIRSRRIQLSETPTKKELMFNFYIDMLHLLDPKGGWAGFFCKQTGVAQPGVWLV